MLTVSTNADLRTTSNTQATTVHLRNPRTIGSCPYDGRPARLYACGWRCPNCAPKPRTAAA